MRDDCSILKYRGRKKHSAFLHYSSNRGLCKYRWAMINVLKSESMINLARMEFSISISKPYVHRTRWNICDNIHCHQIWTSSVFEDKIPLPVFSMINGMGWFILLNVIFILYFPTQNQWETNNGRCSLCGNAYDGPRENKAGCRYATGTIVRQYSFGSVIEVTVQITANHQGYHQFKLCKNDNPSV